jgi:predicted metal-dependent hydrolase
VTSNPAEPSPSPAVEIRRSRRRKQTVSAYREGERTVVLLPAGMRRADEQRWVDEMLRRLAAKDARARRSDADLLRRARTLSTRYFDGSAQPVGVRWVDNQNGRWGSCTPGDRTIRLSRRLDGMPDWVVDYVLVHELAHLMEANHNERFWALVRRYPRTERAMGYLEGITAAWGSGSVPGGDPPVAADVDAGAEP